MSASGSAAAGVGGGGSRRWWSHWLSQGVAWRERWITSRRSPGLVIRMGNQGGT